MLLLKAATIQLDTAAYPIFLYFASMEDLQLYGYFTDKGDKPAYDPGLDVPCIYCRKKLELPVRSYSLMVPGHGKSYFYRVHKACGEQMEASGEDRHYDGLIIDSIEKEL